MDLLVRVHVVRRLPEPVRRAPLPELQWLVGSATPACPGRAGHEACVSASGIQSRLLGNRLTTYLSTPRGDRCSAAQLPTTLLLIYVIVIVFALPEKVELGLPCTLGSKISFAHLLSDHSPSFSRDVVHVICDSLRLGNVRCLNDRNPAYGVLPHGQPFSEGARTNFSP
jgi:hypothetical protein